MGRVLCAHGTDLRVRIEAQPDVLEWLRQTTGWQAAVEEGLHSLPVLKMAPPGSGGAIFSALDVLQENEYVPCEHGAETSLYFADGEVRFASSDPCTQVAPLPSSAGVFPRMALEGALFRSLVLQGALGLHGLAFEVGDCGVLAIGPSGAGKTTLALAALSGGARLASDDRVALYVVGGALLAVSMRDYLQIRRASLRSFPQEALPEVMRQGDYPHESYRHFLGDLPDAFTGVVEVKHLLLLDACDRPQATRLSPANLAEGLAGLIGGSCPYFFSEAGESASPLLGKVLKMLAGVRVSRVKVGHQLLNDPVREFYSLMAALEFGGA